MAEDYINPPLAERPLKPATMLGKKNMKFFEFEAFLYAIARIQTAPWHRRDLGAMLAMCEQLKLAHPDVLAMSLWKVEHFLGQRIDIWPLGYGDEPDGDYSKADQALRDYVRQEADATHDQTHKSKEELELLDAAHEANR